jgi:hypothetical protein
MANGRWAPSLSPGWLGLLKIVIRNNTNLYGYQLSIFLKSGLAIPKGKTLVQMMYVQLPMN